MNRVGKFACAMVVLLCGAGSWAQQAAATDTRPLFGQALDLALPRDVGKVAPGDTRITLRVVPPKGHESQVVFLMRGKSTTAEAMQAVSIRQAFDQWIAAGQAPDLEQWVKTVDVQKANFDVPPEMRTLLDSYSAVNFEGCLKQQDTMPGATHYELWVETAQNVKDIHAYSTHRMKCDGLKYMQQLRQAVRQQVPQLETH